MKYYKQVSVKEDAESDRIQVPIGTVGNVIVTDQFNIIVKCKDMTNSKANDYYTGSRFNIKSCSTKYWKYRRINEAEAFEILL